MGHWGLQMPIRFRENIVNVAAGGPRFAVASDLYDYFFFGDRDQNNFFLEGLILGPPPEFVFNGKLFIPGEPLPGTIIETFPKGPAPGGWIRRQNVGVAGYELVMSQDQNTVLFGFTVRDNTCHVTVNLYDEDQQIFAETTEDTLVIHHGPYLLGRSGIRVE